MAKPSQFFMTCNKCTCIGYFPINVTINIKWTVRRCAVQEVSLCPCDGVRKQMTYSIAVSRSVDNDETLFLSDTSPSSSLKRFPYSKLGSLNLWTAFATSRHNSTLFEADTTLCWTGQFPSTGNVYVRTIVTVKCCHSTVCNQLPRTSAAPPYLC